MAGDPTGIVDAGGREGALARRHQLRGTRLAAGDLDAARRFAPTLVHAWNPRAPVAAAAQAYGRATGAPVLMHWEDDEWSLSRAWRDGSPLRRAVRTVRRGAAGALPAAWSYATPRSLRWAAALPGHDALTPALAERVREMTGRDCAVVLPANPPDDGPIETPPIPPGSRDRELVAYTGAIYPEHRQDVLLAMRAVAELRRRGRDAVFVHSGGILSRYDPVALAAEAGLSADAAHFLGYLPSMAQVRGLLRTADVLVQPGRPTDFNRYRLPSKLQTYLASGTPTVSFAVGFGELLTDGEEALLTRTGETAELADKLETALADPAVRQRLKRGGPSAAARLFDPSINCDALLAHYGSVLDQQPSARGSRATLLNRQ